MANVTGTFTATGQSASFVPRVGERLTQSGDFNVFLTGTAVATLQLERSADNGVTWCIIDSGTGVQIYQWSYSSSNLSVTAEEVEAGVIYRLNCTAYTSGTVAYRISGPA